MDSLIKALPMLFSMVIAGFVYFKIDNKYYVTDKISLKLSIKQEWKASFVFGCAMVITLIIGMISIYIVNIPDALYRIIVGIIAGIGINISVKLSSKKTL